MIHEEIPFGVRIISLINYSLTLCCMLIFIMFFAKNELITSLLSRIPNLIIEEETYLYGGISMIFAIFFFFHLGKGLWNGKVWARHVQVVFGIICFVISLLMLFLGNIFSIAGIIFFATLTLYLIFDKEVDDAFY
jgi:hypothetical protein